MTQLKLVANIISRQHKNIAFLSTDKGSLSNLVYYRNDKKYSTAPAAAEAARTHSSISWEEAKPFDQIPGMAGLSSVRAFLPGGKYYKKDLNQLMTMLFNEFGDIFYMKGSLKAPSFVLTQNPDDIETVFRHDGIWPERPGFQILDYYRNVYAKDAFPETKGLLTSTGKDWGDFRSAVNPVIIHPKNIKVYLPIMSKVNQEFIERIKAIRDPVTLEMPDNFKSEISCWTLESVSVVALDKQLGLIGGHNEEGKKFFQSLLNFFEDAATLETGPSLWRIFPTKRFNQAMKNLDDMRLFCEKHVNESIARIGNSSQETPQSEKGVLEKLLKINKSIATIMAMDMLFAGVDTTTSTFTSLLLCLSKNPDKQEKLRQEILKILPEKDSPLTEEKMKNLPYLRACIKEALRVYPLTNANARGLQENVVLSGYQVPKGTQVALVFMNHLKDPAYYSEPEKFLPERWLRQAKGEESCPHAPTKSKHPFVYLPFGFGPRSCIGRRIAEMEMEIGIARILRNFHVEYNYPANEVFKMFQLHIPVAPLKFKFVDLDY